MMYVCISRRETYRSLACLDEWMVDGMDGWSKVSGVDADDGVAAGVWCIGR